MNIDEMPAGREMDALVAEKVLGHSVHRCPAAGQPWMHHGDWEELTIAVLVPHCPESCHGGSWKPLPKFSANIAAAWDVAKKCEANDATRQLDRGDGILTYTVAGLFTEELLAQLRAFRYDHLGDLRLTDLTPIRICRAALKAVGDADASQACGAASEKFPGVYCTRDRGHVGSHWNCSPEFFGGAPKRRTWA